MERIAIAPATVAGRAAPVTGRRGQRRDCRERTRGPTLGRSPPRTRDPTLTTAPIRPRRSILYMPAANARALEKAQTLDADGFIFDLEDAVAPDAKENARRQLHEALARFDYRGRERVVRVNGLDTRWAADDLRMAAVNHRHFFHAYAVGNNGDCRFRDAR